MLFGCRAVSSQQHIGLQQLLALGKATKSSIGPNKTYKFVENEVSGESSLVSSPLHLLEHLDLSCPVSQLFLETVQAHQKAFGTGSGTLTFLAGAWSLGALQCIWDGIPVCDVVSTLIDGLDSCTETCLASCLSVTEAIVSKSFDKAKSDNLADGNITSVKVTGQVTNKATTTSDAILMSPQPISRSSSMQFNQENKASASLQHKVKLRHSRYFSGQEETNVKETNSESSLIFDSSFSCLCDIKSQDIGFLANTVSHGHHNLMNLVIEASKIQIKNSKDRNCCTDFNVNKLNTCLLPGVSEEYSCVTSGLVAFVSFDQASLIQHLKNQSLQIVIFNGDLSDKYHHLGFSKPLNIRYVAENLDQVRVKTEDKWVRDVVDTLLQLGVNLLLVNGVVCERLTELCICHGIVVVERVNSSVLKDFAEATGAVPITYITQMSKRCIGQGVHVAIWREGNGDTQPVAINISTVGTALVTAVITSTVQSKLKSLEYHFWGCAYRLHHALQDKKLLCGGGKIEMVCIHHLLGLIRDNDLTSEARGQNLEASNQNRSLVLQRMLYAWMDYIATLMWNTGECSSKLEGWTTLNQALEQGSSGSAVLTGLLKMHPQLNSYFQESSGDGRSILPVYDNVTVKFEAWRRAMDLVLMVLQTDMEIITGCSTRTTEGLPVDYMLL